MHEIKEEVILSILAQESMKSELWLRRYDENKFLGSFCNFWKVARVNLELFLKIWGSYWNFVDYGLILDKNRGLSTKWRGFLDFGLIFEWKKHMDWVHGSWTAMALIHGGLGHGWPKRLTGARPSSHSGARRLTGEGAIEREEHGESVSGLTEARAVVRRSFDGGEEVVVESFSAGGAWARREEKEDEERCGGGR
jgi:hypothetical protein